MARLCSAASSSRGLSTYAQERSSTWRSLARCVMSTRQHKEPAGASTTTNSCGGGMNCSRSLCSIRVRVRWPPKRWARRQRTSFTTSCSSRSPARRRRRPGTTTPRTGTRRAHRSARSGSRSTLCLVSEASRTSRARTAGAWCTGSRTSRAATTRARTPTRAWTQRSSLQCLTWMRASPRERTSY